MIVVADATPINVLARIERTHVLERIFGRVLVPPAVAEELAHPAAPELVRRLMAERPSRLEIQSPSSVLSDVDLGRGETEAMALAAEIRADYLLMDDRRARAAAERIGLVTIGTLAVLSIAAERGLVDFEGSVEHLRRIDFRMSASLIDRIRRERGGSGGEGKL